MIFQKSYLFEFDTPNLLDSRCVPYSRSYICVAFPFFITERRVDNFQIGEVKILLSFFLSFVLAPALQKSMHTLARRLFQRFVLTWVTMGVLFRLNCAVGALSLQHTLSRSVPDPSWFSPRNLCSQQFFNNFSQPFCIRKHFGIQVYIYELFLCLGTHADKRQHIASWYQVLLLDFFSCTGTISQFIFSKKLLKNLWRFFPYCLSKVGTKYI